MDPDFGAALSLFKGYFNRYDQFVRLNPRVAAEIEAIIRWSSYLIATKKSPVLGELLSSGANLLQLCNDIILRSTSSQLKLDLTDCVTQLKTFLSVIHSLELLAEIYVRETYGNIAKWAIITVIQIAKAGIKLILLLSFDQGISKSQYIVPLDRLHFAEIVKLTDKLTTSSRQSSDDENQGIQEITESQDKSIILKSSGRKMRSITESPPRNSRFTESKKRNKKSDPFEGMRKQRLTLLIDRYREHRSAALTDRQLYGEILHIARPVAHLALMGALGPKSWFSYLASIAMDISSLYLVRSPSLIDLQANSTDAITVIPEIYRFNLNERMELGQRVSSMLLYLLRSPFFDKYTKQKALEGLASSSESIPLVGNFLATFFNYIPDWQKDYFRVWSD